MSGIYNLLDHFPDISFDQSNIDSYHTELIAEMEHVREFIILHYCTTKRDDSPLWAYCQTMTLPDSLLSRMEIYRRNGRIRARPGEVFTDLSWFYIYCGMGVQAERHDPLMDVVRPDQLRAILAGLARSTATAVEAAPSHDSYFADPPVAAGPAPLARAAGGA